MNTINFKTNIKCAACVAKVTPALNEAVGENNWSVDLTHPDRILTVVKGEPEEITASLERVGYFAKKIS